MICLGIDFSLNGTGLSIFNGENVIDKKLFTIKDKVYKTDTNLFQLIPDIKKQEEKLDFVVSEILKFALKDVDFVCLEDHIGRYYNWMDGYGIIKHYLRVNKIPYICVAPAQLKKYAGSGKADKTQMSYYLRHDYNLDFDYLGDTANNLVDATWLAILGYHYYNTYIESSKLSLTPARKEILNKIYKKG
jgi:Holliday junction resolvasome RuvABC endonuclease subunit